MITITVTLSGIGGQIKEDWKEGDGTTSAVTIRIADFINNVVATRRYMRTPSAQLIANLCRLQAAKNRGAGAASSSDHEA